jgi:cytidylate kinase
MYKITIAIDGHSSTGKSTVAKQLADYLGYIYVDSGAMYRAVTLYALRKGCIDDGHLDRERLLYILNDISLEFKKNDSGRAEIFLNGENVEQEIRAMQVSEHVSLIATVSEVRKKLVQQQQSMVGSGGVVMDGRDIGTVVFPKAELKIFMTASASVRAQRRFQELLSKGIKVTFEEVLENVTERDQMDSQRLESPLKIAADAIVIDNSEMNLEDQFYMILQLAKDRIAGRI